MSAGMFFFFFFTCMFVLFVLCLWTLFCFVSRLVFVLFCLFYLRNDVLLFVVIASVYRSVSLSVYTYVCICTYVCFHIGLWV